MAPQHLARIAGILYLVLAVAGGFSQLVVRGGVLRLGRRGRDSRQHSWRRPAWSSSAS